MLGEQWTENKVYPNQLKRLKRVEKLPRLKSRQIFSYASPRNHLIFQAKLLLCPCKWANKTVLRTWKRIVQMGTPILYLLVTFCFVSVRFWESEVRVALSFSLLMRGSEKCMSPKYYRIELKDTGNRVHISNVKETSRSIPNRIIWPIYIGYGWVFCRRNSLFTGLFGLCRSWACRYNRGYFF